MTTRVAILFWVLAIPVSRVQLAQAKEPALVKLTGPTMGSRYSVSLAAPTKELSQTLLQKMVHARLADINRQISTYYPAAELAQFNATSSTEWFAVSPATAKLVKYALQLAEDSGGAFDPTIGPVVNLWGFGPDAPPEAEPSAERIATALAEVGYHKLEVRTEPPTLRKRTPQLKVDLSALGQGYATDDLIRLLNKLGVTAALVDVTGEIRTLGVKPDGSAWQVQIQAPPGGATNRMVKLCNESIATSGSYQNSYQFGGKRYSHTMNPRTGRPVEHSLVSVTVRTPRCLDADAWATTLLVLGPEAGWQWAEERNIAALFVEQTANGYRERVTPAWGDD